MSATLEVTIDDTEIRQIIDRLSDRVIELSKPMKLAAEHMRWSIDENFKVGGRPAWLPSKRALKQAGQTLVNKRLLQDSITYAYDHATIEIGTNLKYAGVHQFGFSGSVNIRSHTRKVKSRDVRVTYEQAGKRRRKIIAKGIGFVSSHTRRMNIPARPFLVVQDEDVAEIKHIIKDYLLGLS